MAVSGRYCLRASQHRSGSSAHALTINLNPSKDNTLYQSLDGSLSNGQGLFLFAGATNTGELRRAVLAFDVAGSIPAGATITAAALTLNISKAQVAGTPMTLHRLSADWGEGASTAAGQEGTGAPSALGDATWIHKFYNTSPWTVPGGDFLAAVSATQTTGVSGPFTWGSTAPMVGDVQGWLDNPANNFGWILLGDEVNTATAKRFDAGESATPSHRPILSIQYTTVAEPTSAALAIGIALVFGFARRVVRPTP